MGNAAFAVYRADIASGFASFSQRTRKHPLMFGWFFVLFWTAIWMIGAIIDLALRRPDTVFIEFDATWAYFSIYFLFFTLGALGTHFRMMRNSDLTLVLTTPARHSSVMAGKFMTTFWLNMGIYCLGLGSMLVMIYISGFIWFITLQIYVTLTLLAILGTCAGFLISLLGSIRPLYRKAAFLWMGSFYLTAVWYCIGFPWLALTAMLLFLICTCAASIAVMSIFFLEGWNAQTTVHSDFGRGSAKYLISLTRKMPLSAPAKSVATKEFLFNARTRENIGSALTVIGIIAAEVGVIQTLGPRNGLKMDNAYLVYPIVNAMALYIGAILFCTVEGMTLLGKEAKGVWVMKSMPVNGRTVMAGKAVSALVISLFLLAVAVPIPYLIYHNWKIVIFSVIGLLAIMMAYMGIGLWIGATTPNFTTSFRGTPDIITLYSTMMLCLVLGAVLLFPALVVLHLNMDMGLVTVCISAIIGLAVLFFGTAMAGRAYDRLEVNL